MINHQELANIPTDKLIESYPFLETFLDGIPIPISSQTIHQWFDSKSPNYLEEHTLNEKNTIDNLAVYITNMLSFLGENKNQVDSITILPGTDKNGNKENFDKLCFKRGDIISIVGPTGSGKSRLLADIEWIAQGDTPTGRQILINNEIPDMKKRFSPSDKLVAQLSQNMNFVMDLSVQDFLELHAESRLINNAQTKIAKIINSANQLAGESFNPQTAITSLSGGQSRALMIADTAYLSRSPIVLIDEIENAGIDRQKALDLLLSEEKIVLIATHDPVLALSAQKRLIIAKGAIIEVIESSPEEREILSEIQAMDDKVQNLRNKLRNGKKLN